MPRKQSVRAGEALVEGRYFHRTNTAVRGDKMFLFGNKIAWLKEGGIHITSCGEKTQTTRSRLSGIPGVDVSQCSGRWFLNNKLWEFPELETRVTKSGRWRYVD